MGYGSVKLGSDKYLRVGKDRRKVLYTFPAKHGRIFL